MSISVLVLTLNEEINIADCLRSVSWCDDVIVLDSFSTDRTTQIADSLGARVVQRPFDDYASQRNFGLQLEYRHPWVLMIDADERVPADLHAEMVGLLDRSGPAVTLLRMRRRDHLFGRWIRRSSGYPTWFPRLARVAHTWVERPYNEVYRTDGEVISLKAHLDHFPFNKGFHEWIAKHDRYSTMEADLRHRKGDDPWRWIDLLARDPGIRRAAVKGLIYSLPMRPVVVFSGLYLLRGGILEGRAGLTFCLLRAWYEFMIDCKLRELRRRARHLPV
jgi:glycosyltransferase involved in cell wall biosynthesis